VALLITPWLCVKASCGMGKVVSFDAETNY